MREMAAFLQKQAAEKARKIQVKTNKATKVTKRPKKARGQPKQPLPPSKKASHVPKKALGSSPDKLKNVLTAAIAAGVVDKAMSGNTNTNTKADLVKAMKGGLAGT